MDLRNHENSIRKYDEKSLEKLQYKLVFGDPAYQFVFKKTEKIIAALYLITNLVSDSEPMKWQLRKIALGLMSDILSVRRSSSEKTKAGIQGLLVTLSEILSLLKIASISEQISSMNFSVMHREIGVLMNSLDSIHLDTISSNPSVLSQDFFNISTPATFPLGSAVSGAFNNSNGQPFSPKGQYKTPNAIKDTSNIQAPKDNLKDIRKEKMLQLLKAGKPLGIKDFAQEIKDCSEKTIQRELLAMVESGVLKKTGERRWSTYSLA